MAVYKESDVELVYGRGDWNSWDDIVGWFQKRLQSDDQADNELGEQETHELLEDFRRLSEKGEPFTSDPKKAFEALQAA